MKRNLIILTLVVFACSSSFLLSKRQAVAEEDADQTFAGLKFGVGIALTVGIGEKPSVESASIVEGIVRVDEERDATATIMLESHYLFKTGTTLGRDVGIGPFVVIQPGGSDEIVEAFGLGVMIGFKRKPETNADTSSWNLGVAYVIDPSVKVLGDGFEENQPPPAGETGIRFKEVSDTGILFLVSFNF